MLFHDLTFLLWIFEGGSVLFNYTIYFGQNQYFFRTLLFEKVTNGLLKFSDYEYADLLEYYKEASSKFVPDLQIQPEITISYVPKSLEDNFSPACYFVSPLDVKNKESIYLNGKWE